MFTWCPGKERDWTCLQNSVYIAIQNSLSLDDMALDLFL
jgi:hypothetical protein